MRLLNRNNKYSNIAYIHMFSAICCYFQPAPVVHPNVVEIHLLSQINNYGQKWSTLITQSNK